jgi:Short C-terminal domain
LSQNHPGIYLAQYKQKSFSYLQDHKFREACRSVAEHRQKRVYFTELGAHLSEPYDGSGDIERLEFIFKSKPKILLHLGEPQLEQLRIATGMSVLWGDKASDWLPNTSATSLSSADIAAHMLLCNARLNEDKEQLRSSSFGRVSEIILERYRGLGVCDLCDYVFERPYKSVDEVPELPVEGCISETGCNFYLRLKYAFELESDNGDFEEDSDDGDELDIDNSFEKLKQLKQMLDAGLITQQEYDAKKAQILSEM